MTRREEQQLLQQVTSAIDELTTIKTKLQKLFAGRMELITIKEASERYGINENTLRTWKRKDKIGYSKDARGVVLNAEEIENLTCKLCKS
jgi:uncharacterized protein YjcR